jgi:hypothetical protein
MVAIHHPDDFEPFSESEQTGRDIDALNDEMNARGVIVFVGGMGSPRAAKSVRVREGKPIVSDGPYLETKEHIGGFWVLELATLDEGVEWGKKAAIACRAPVEVRGFFSAAEARAGG